MSEQERIAIYNLIASLGIQAGATVLQSVGKAATIDDAIAALQAAATKTAQDYLNEVPPQPK